MLAAQRKKQQQKGVYHSRGRSLLEIKNEIEKRGVDIKLDKGTQQTSNAIFGVSLGRDNMHTRNLSRDSMERGANH